MASTPSRLKLKQGPIDKWSIRERLSLACSVMRSGDQNWVSVSRAIRPFGEPNRPADWFSQKNCALQYSDLLEKVETPKRKRGDREAIETPGDQIVRKLTIERIEDLKRIVQVQAARYKQLKREVRRLKSGKEDDRIKEVWEEMVAEKKAKEEAKALAEQKVAEEAKARAQAQLAAKVALRQPPTPGNKPKKPMPKNLRLLQTSRSGGDSTSEADDNTMDSMPDTLNVEVKTEGGATSSSGLLQVQQHPAGGDQGKPKATPPASPLLSSLLQSKVKFPDGFTTPKQEPILEANATPQTTEPATQPASAVAPPTPAAPPAGQPEKSVVESSVPAQVKTADVPSSPSAGAPTLSKLLGTPPTTPAKPPPAVPTAGAPSTAPPVGTPATPAASAVPATPTLVENIKKEPQVVEAAEPDIAPIAEKEEEEEKKEEEKKEEKVEDEQVVAQEQTPHDDTESDENNVIPAAAPGAAETASPTDDVCASETVAGDNKEVKKEEEEEEKKEDPPVKQELESAPSTPAGGGKEEEDVVKEEPPSPASSVSSKVSEQESTRGRKRARGRGRKSHGGRRSSGRVTRRSVAGKGESSSKHSEADSSDEETVAESDDASHGPSRPPTAMLSESVPNSPASQSQSDTEDEKAYKAWKKSIMLVWRAAANHKYANVFLHPVTNEIAPGYPRIVYRPIDLTMIKKNIENGTIRTTSEFQRDMMLMFTNAIMYNNSDHDVYIMAQEMYSDVMMHIEQYVSTQMMVQSDTKILRTSRRSEVASDKEEDIRRRRASQDTIETGGKTKKRKTRADEQ